MKMSRRKIYFISLALLILLGLYLNSYQDISVETLKEVYANEASQFLELADMQVHYRDEGPKTDSLPIVLLHGTAASLHTWDGWTELLNQKGRRVIRMDLPAFGLTGPSPSNDYSVEAYAHFVHHFLQKLGVEKFILSGNSLGGYISWYYASQHASQVEQLVLLDPSGYPSDKTDPYIFRLARTPVINQAFLFITPKALMRNNLEQVYFDDSKLTDAIVNRYHDMALRKGNRQAFIERSKTPFVDHSALLSKIDIPTLIIWGEQDTWIPASLGPKYIEAMPNASLAIMPEMGHVPMEEAPKESLQLLLDFIKD